MKPAAFAWGIVAVAAVAAYAVRPGATDFWNPDEPRAAEVAREMRLTRDPLYLQVNGEHYTDKPPFLYWLIAAQGEVTEVTARLPSIVATLALLLLVGCFVRKRFGDRAAILSVVILASSPMILWLGRRAAFDPLLTFFITAAILAFYKSGETGRWSGALLSGVLGGLGFLTKGPPAAVVPALALIPLMIVERRGLLRAIIAILGGAAVVALWFFPAMNAGGPDFVGRSVLHNLIERGTDPWSHQRPWYEYFKNLPAEYFPWIMLAPFAAARVRRSEPFSVLCAAWFIGPILFFSLFHSKRNVYLLPIYPAGAMLIGIWLDRANLRKTAAIVPAVVALAAVGLFLVAFDVLKISGTEPLHEARDAVLIACTVLSTASCFSSVLMREHGAAAMATLAIGILAASVCVFQTVLPKLNVYNSAKPLAQDLVAGAPPNAEWVQVDQEQFGLIFYSHHYFKMIKNASGAIRPAMKEPKLYYGVTTPRGFESLRAEFGEFVRETARGRIGHKETLIVFVVNLSPPVIQQRH